MELRAWSYDEFPEFDEEAADATWLETSGKEMGARYVPNVEYERIDGVGRVLQILIPTTREHPAPRKGRDASAYHPCVVYVQGSAWMTQDVHSNLPCIARLAARGYVVAVVQYRESGIGVFPDQVRDARNAVRFMRVHAAEYAVDPTRVALMGDSSGGHTATYAGTLHDDGSEHDLFPGTSGEVGCIVNYYGSTDFTFEDANPSTPDHNAPTSPEGRVMGGVDLNRDRAARDLLTVRCNIDEGTRMAPVLTFHGTKDRTVNTRCSVLLHRHLVETGHDSALYLLRGADHGGPEFWAPQVLDIVDAFLREHLGA
ncbi:MAG: alpha/beta hydrolase [Acidobacteriota bacterium]|nr:alpha/beta hydrolase [Acidobacteriota bacterium]